MINHPSVIVLLHSIWLEIRVCKETLFLGMAPPSTKRLVTTLLQVQAPKARILVLYRNKIKKMMPPYRLDMFLRC